MRLCVDGGKRKEYPIGRDRNADRSMMNRLDATSLAAAFGRLPADVTIVLHAACAEPRRLVGALLAHARHFRSIRIVTLTQMNDAPYADPDAYPNVSVLSFVPGRGLRRMIAAKRGPLIGLPLSRSAEPFKTGAIKVDAVFLQLSNPDESGCMSLGIAVDFLPAVFAQKPKIFAEINPLMPFTFGDTRIAPEQIDYACDSADPPYTVEPDRADPIEARIADNIAQLIENGAVLQSGIGTLPDLLMRRLTGHHDLGLYTGMFTDAAQPLIEQGVINNAFNPAFKGRSVATMACGTAAFYRFLSRNPAVEFHPCSVTHDFRGLAAIPSLVAMNSVLEVDLGGQANAEALNGRVISAPGGLPDFAQGAKAAAHGVSIIALRATSRDGGESRILPVLDATAPVTVDAAHIDYIVTEFGSARITGLTGRRRAQAIAEIAHPEFRAGLRHAA